MRNCSCCTVIRAVTKKLSTGANGQKADGTSPFVRAVLKKLSCRNRDLKTVTWAPASASKIYT